MSTDETQEDQIRRQMHLPREKTTNLYAGEDETDETQEDQIRKQMHLERKRKK